MTRYEALLLTRPDITTDELSSIEGQIQKLISDSSGTMTSFDKWGKYRLNYPIKNNNYGVYALCRFELPENKLPATMAKLGELFRIKWNEHVVRYVTKRLAKDAPLTYVRPEIVEREERSSEMGRSSEGGFQRRGGFRGERRERRDSEYSVNVERDHGKI